MHAALRRETKEERLLRAINGLMDERARRDEHGDTWRVASAEIHAALLDLDVPDIHERAGDFTKMLLEVGERTRG